MNLFQLYLDAAALPSAADQQRFIEVLAQKSAKLAEKLTALLADTPHTLHLTDDIRLAASRLQQLDISAELTGKRLSYWQLDRIIAHGGMSTVYLASRQDGQFEQHVAIKVLNPLIYPVSPHSQAFSEANVAAKLNHPGMTKVFDAGITEHQGQQAHYIVMEYIAGQNLDTWLKTHKPKLQTLVQLFIELCDVLHFAHTHQIIHADLKPENILVDEHGKPKLIDFGIARLQQQNEQAPAFVQHYVKALSRQYASPEQFTGEPLTTLSDVYSLGKVLQYSQRYSQKTTPLHQAELTAIIEMATQAQPQQRFQSILHFLNQLTSLLQDKPVECYKTGVVYRLRKFVARQPAFSAAFGVCLLLVGLACVGIYQYQRNLQIEQQQSKWLIEFMTGLFENASPQFVGKTKPTAEDLLEIASYQLLSNTTMAKQHKAILQMQVVHAMLALNNLIGARKVFEQMPPQTHPNLKYLHHFYAAELAYLENNFESALKEYRLAERYFVQNANFQVTLNRIKIKMFATYGKLNDREAIAEMEKGIAALSLSNEETILFLQEAAEISLQKANSAQSISYLNRAVANAQNDAKLAFLLPTILLKLAQSQLMERAYRDADKTLSQVQLIIQNMPQQKHLLFGILDLQGASAAFQGDFASSLTLRKKALALAEEILGAGHEDTIRLKSNICNSLMNLSEFSEAVDCFRLFVADLAKLPVKPFHYALYLRSYANALLKNQQYESALEVIDHAIASSANPNFFLYTTRADILFALNHPQEALSYYEQAIQTMQASAPESQNTIYLTLRAKIEIAKILFSLGNTLEACEMNQTALSSLVEIVGSDSHDLNAGRSLAEQCNSLRSQQPRIFKE